MIQNIVLFASNFKTFYLFRIASIFSYPTMFGIPGMMIQNLVLFAWNSKTFYLFSIASIFSYPTMFGIPGMMIQNIVLFAWNFKTFYLFSIASIFSYPTMFSIPGMMRHAPGCNLFYTRYPTNICISHSHLCRTKSFLHRSILAPRRSTVGRSRIGNDTRGTYDGRSIGGHRLNVGQHADTLLNNLIDSILIGWHLFEHCGCLPHVTGIQNYFAH